MNKIINIGVMGCAAIANRSVIPAILALPECFKLVAVASRNVDKAKEFADRFGCESVIGYDTLLERQDIEAIYMPLPTGLHKKWINEALSKGKHVYAEKSMAMNYSDATQMVKNAKQFDIALMEGFMFQYHSQHQIVFDILKTGEIGEVRHFASKFGFPPLESGNFRYDNEIGGGALLDAAGYVVRSAHFILGDSFKVRSATMKFDPKTGASLWGTAFMCNASGVGASLSFGFDNFYQCSFEIWGSKGKITAERAFTPRFDYYPKIIVENKDSSRVIECSPDNHFAKAMIEFHGIVSGSRDKQKHYKEILIQSQSLDLIKKYSLENEKQ
ncbi:MAG: Gfo/Idh/MocA family oxidoreductase [Ignavibacteria bacterium]|nr:Gfo/Idh/MocA family oxidoreductase [Ignavibacteria bacterium]